VDRWHDASTYVYLSILLFAQTMEDFMLHGCFPSKVRTFFYCLWWSVCGRVLAPQLKRHEIVLLKNRTWFPARNWQPSIQQWEHIVGRTMMLKQLALCMICYRISLCACLYYNHVVVICISPYTMRYQYPLTGRYALNSSIVIGNHKGDLQVYPKVR
jgi:hypothetical protein